MNLTVTYFDHPLHIAISPAASSMLEKTKTALQVDARLYFGCLAKKAVIFNEAFAPKPAYMINSKLYVRYQSLISDGCKIDSSETHYRPTPKPMGSLYWLEIDYRKGQWMGDFGFEDKLTAQDHEKTTLQPDFSW
ncbi:MAG: Unknown protein [uncultured Thiotrichaceae bacterium]|uniref:Uncharacterized protein n=1 Tax=uncultured Thiotrichaceae bacterium TaxID=298394 RepID=A0A6S6TKN0_9GAMM|nr:MAG: Unknown protein [uncultured Thiotrichaceae bacterium]